MNELVNEKVILITGAKGGLGSSITEAFLSTGAKVIGASRKIAASDFPQPNFEPLPVDFTKADEVRVAINRIITQHGRLDALIQVLGGFAGGQTVAATTDDTWEQMR